MLLLEELLTPVAALLYIPVGVVMFAALALIGVIGHYAIYRVVSRMTTAADQPKCNQHRNVFPTMATRPSCEFVFRLSSPKYTDTFEGVLFIADRSRRRMLRHLQV